MAKLTLSGLTTLVNTVVDADNIAQDSPFVPTYDSITGLLNKIGKQFMLDSNFEDALPELEGEALPFGATIEEYFVDLVLPVANNDAGSSALAPARPTFETVAYSYPLAEYMVPVTVDDQKMQRGMLGQSEYSSLVANISKRLYDSIAVYKYGVKRQALGRLIDLAGTFGVSNDKIVQLAMPSDTASAEAFAKSIKNKVEAMSLLSEGFNLMGVVARSQISDLTLYVKKGIRSVLDVDLDAGTFNIGKVQVPVTMKVVEDFGTLATHTNAYAILVDTRGVRVHPAKNTISSQYNGQGEFTTFWGHYKPTAFISKAVNFCIWETAA